MPAESPTSAGKRPVQSTLLLMVSVLICFGGGTNVWLASLLIGPIATLLVVILPRVPYGS